MPHMTKNISPPTKPPRVSVPLSPEAHEAFTRLAKAGNMSVGGAIASWLDDTLDAVGYLASTMERARAAPRIVAKELHAYALGLADETGDLIKKVQAMGSAERARSASAARHDASAPTIPPSCNTGGKLPKTQTSPKGGNSRFPLPPAKVQAHANTNGVPPKGPK